MKYDEIAIQEKSLTRTMLKILKKGRVYHPYLRYIKYGYNDTMTVGNDIFYEHISNREKRRLKGIYQELKKRLNKTSKACKFYGKINYEIIDLLLSAKERY